MNSVKQTGFDLGFFFCVGSSLDILCASTSFGNLDVQKRYNKCI